MRTTIYGCFLALLALIASPLAAQTCGGTYKVQSGDSLSLIADTLYKNAGMWTAIHSNNLSAIGENPNSIHAGMRLSLSCIDGLPLGLEGGVVISNVTATSAVIETQPGTAATRSKINLLTASDYAPFTDKNLPNGGLFTDVVNMALTEAQPDQGYAIHWVEDWGSHFDPLLSNALLDAGFPWYKPDCTSTPDDYRCSNFLFSDPMFEMLILLFTNKSNPVTFARDEDLFGKTLCRPNGYFTHDLDRGDRRWLTDGKVTLVQPQTVADCFEMLIDGEIDAVAMNEFTGRTALKDLDLKDKVEIVQSRPLSIEGLHVLVHKTHPQAEDMLATINGGLREIKSNGVYQQIIDTHMTRVWAEF